VRCETILDAIGGTPVVRLRRVIDDLPIELWAKVEALNPGGSSKDRLARYLVERAEARGELKPGATLVEASAGNTGIGLSLVAAVRGYHAVIVVPAGTSPGKLSVARAYGAEVHTCTSDEDYEEVAKAFARRPGWFRPNQFESLDNPSAHGASTAAELWSDLDGRIDAVVATSGTGGTLAGLGRALKGLDDKIALVRAVPETIDGGESELEGIASDGPPASFACPPIDELVRIADDDARKMAQRLAREEGLLVGGSSGAAVAGALVYARRRGSALRIVAILPDTGRNYLLP
jgi:cystathionine beta-synthase